VDGIGANEWHGGPATAPATQQTTPPPNGQPAAGLSMRSSGFELASYTDTGKTFATQEALIANVTREALERTPAWRPALDGPPLSAGRALAAADAVAAELLTDTADFKWELVRVELVPMRGNKWIWIMCYEAAFQGGSGTGAPFFLHVPVLMDGTVVQPVKEP
jgi:hypothetical protein